MASASTDGGEAVWQDADFLSFGNDDNEGSVNDDNNSEDRSANDQADPRSWSEGELPPWMDRYTDFRRVSPLVALHNEAVGFSQLISPTTEVR
jgi:hypothetical protein